MRAFRFLLLAILLATVVTTNAQRVAYTQWTCPMCKHNVEARGNVNPATTPCPNCGRTYNAQQASQQVAPALNPGQYVAQSLFGAFLGAMATSDNSDNSQQIEQERQRRILEEIKSVEDANQQRKALGQAITLQRTAREAANKQTDEEMKSAMDDSWMLTSIDKPKKTSRPPKTQEASNLNIVNLRETNSTVALLKTNDLAMAPGTPLLPNKTNGFTARKNLYAVISTVPPVIPRAPAASPVMRPIKLPPPPLKMTEDIKAVVAEGSSELLDESKDIIQELIESKFPKSVVDLKKKLEQYKAYFDDLTTINKDASSAEFMG